MPGDAQQKATEPEYFRTGSLFHRSIKTDQPSDDAPAIHRNSAYL